MMRRLPLASSDKTKHPFADHSSHFRFLIFTGKRDKIAY